MSDPAKKAPRVHRAWLLFLPLAFIELVGSLVVRARVPAEGDWHLAADHIAAEWTEGDEVTVAPRWADPLLRQALGASMGDAFTNELAAPVGLEGRTRLWVVSIRGRNSALTPDSAPEHVETFGRVRVERYVLGGRPLLFDFVDAVEAADGARGDRPCTRTTGRASGGGLGAGPVLAPERLSCGGEMVAETVIEDLHFEARRCIAQHPVSGDAVVLRFPEATLGELLVVHAGLHWVDERMLEGSPVTLTVRAGETELGTITHHDGDGWATYPLTVPPELRGAQVVSFEVTSERPIGRSCCWAARALGAAP